MPYYQGDFYQGDYYGGDPGLGGFFRKIGGALVRRIPVVGGLIGAIGGGRRAAPLALPAAAGVAATSAMERIGGTAGAIVRRTGSAIIKHPVISAAAAAGTLGALAGREAGVAGMVPAGMRGYHIEKRGKRAGQLIRNRRMRVTNPKALRRALRRAHGFAKLAMRTIHLVHPRKKVRFGGFRKKKARAV